MMLDTKHKLDYAQAAFNLDHGPLCDDAGVLVAREVQAEEAQVLQPGAHGLRVEQVQPDALRPGQPAAEGRPGKQGIGTLVDLPADDTVCTASRLCAALYASPLRVLRRSVHWGCVRCLSCGGTIVRRESALPDMRSVLRILAQQSIAPPDVVNATSCFIGATTVGEPAQ